MGIYFNPKNRSFSKDRNYEIYVDKTELLKYTNYSNEDGTSGLITCDGKTVS